MIYIDDAKIPKRGTVWCHMVSDAPSGDDGELMQFAASIGLKYAWMQKAGKSDAHFDVVPSKKELAIKRGAIPITTKQVGRLLIMKLKGEEAKFQKLKKGKK